MPLIRPVRGVVHVTQPFGAVGFAAEPAGSLYSDAHGAQRARFGRVAGWHYFDHLHKGEDIAVPIGTPLVAPQAGIVVAHATYTHGPDGKPYARPELELSLQIRPGSIIVLAHLSAFLAAVGQHVAQGLVIARSGLGGNSTGPHVHWELGVGPATQGWRSEYGWTRWNVERMLVGGDLAGWAAIQPV